MDDNTIYIIMFFLLILLIIGVITANNSQCNELKNNDFFEEFCYLEFGENYTYLAESGRKEVMCKNIQTNEVEMIKNYNLKTYKK